MTSVRTVVMALLTSTAICACGSDSPVVPPPAQPTTTPLMPRRYRAVEVMTAAAESVYNVRMNDRNEVVANLRDGDTTFHAVIWRNGSTTTMAGCVRTSQINARGQVACYSSLGVGLWQDGSLTRVAGTESIVTSIYFGPAVNDSGDVAGAVMTQCTGCSVYYAHAGHVSFLDSALPPPFFPFSIIRMNNAGAVLATDFRGGYSYDAYVVRGGRLVDTLDLGLGTASDMNDSGQIVGSFLYHPGNSVVLTKNVPGFPKLFGVGRSINNREQIVGRLILPAYQNGDSADASASGPFYWDRASGVLKLTNAATDPAWTITDAWQINNSGAILAVGDNVSAGLRNRIVLLVPVQ